MQSIKRGHVGEEPQFGSRNYINCYKLNRHAFLVGKRVSIDRSIMVDQ